MSKRLKCSVYHGAVLCKCVMCNKLNAQIPFLALILPFYSLPLIPPSLSLLAHSLQKFVSTTLRPTVLPYPEFFNWEGCTNFVSDFLSLELLDPPTDPVRTTCLDVCVVEYLFKISVCICYPLFRLTTCFRYSVLHCFK